MIFKCKNCGGNVVYSPIDGEMICPHCESEGSEEVIIQESSKACINCGAEIDVKDFTSATKCSHCGTYVILDEKISSYNKPDLVLPFKIDKMVAVELLRKRFKNSLFAPSDFLGSTTLEKTEGIYVPFWLYDYYTNIKYEGIGVKIRKWTSGNKEYTEKSRYAIRRELDIIFLRLPVDASIEMDNEIMRDVEPYEYKEMLEFNPKFLSGFYSEVYNDFATNLEVRAQERVKEYTDEWVQSTIIGYNYIEGERKDLSMKNLKNDFALLPVWVYTYRFNGKNIRYYVNGQTGEAIGRIPCSKVKVIGYGILTFLLLFVFLYLLFTCMGVLNIEKI